MAKRSLLEKYEIPVSHLDFEYVKKCENGKEMEKIVKILRSGQEGYFPDLTKCAEEKLAILMPNSTLFRFEENLRTKGNLGESEWKKETAPVVEWSDNVKIQDNFLHTISNEKPDEKFIPPIRHEKTKKIDLNNVKNIKTDTTSQRSSNVAKKSNVASTDYRKWDKFDADTEILKMDLEEERAQEEIERMNKKNLLKSKELIKDVTEVNKEKEILQKLTNVEKEKLAMNYKDRGNEYFKSKEYETALKEYTKSIEIFPSAMCYNNRAVAYLKKMDYKNCIQDCNLCLKIEPKNLKALLRKGQALLGLDHRRDAYDVYSIILSIDPSNIAARNAINDLKKQLPDLPPTNATRIKIQEDMTGNEIIKNDVSSVKTKTDQFDSKIAEKDCSNVSVTALTSAPASSTASQTISACAKISESKSKKSCYNYVQEDLSKLIIPKKYVKSKVAKTLDAMKNAKVSNKDPTTQLQLPNSPTDLKLSAQNETVNKNERILIEEIK